MSMSTHVYGFRNPYEDTPENKHWQAMERAYHACEAAGIPIPDEVDEYFQGEPPPRDAGQPIDISAAVDDYKGEMEEGFDITLGDLPEGVFMIRVVNSY